MMTATAPVEVGLAFSEAPRSPLSISSDSSRRSSLRQRLPEKDSELPTPSSPLFRLTRKRAASLDTDSANDPRIEDLALNSATSNGPPTSDSTREQVCLCQPDPKIPRPRNAFILYRQHYQTHVVAQNPKLANPEISKIIGEQWREQAPEVKDEWKKLAEEEKQIHQRRYPGYRYQPRRGGKSNVVLPLSSSPGNPVHPARCPKCNGRSISTPSTPLTPFTPAFGAGPRNERAMDPPTPSRITEIERPRYTGPMQSARMDTPRTVLPHQQAHGRAQYPYPQPLQTHRERDEDMDLMALSSPDLKRRRFNENQRSYVANSPVSYPAPQQLSRNGGPPMSAGPYRQQLPRPGLLGRPGTMGPPPQHSPTNQQARSQYPIRSSTFDESLRLPPLQTQISSSNSTSQRPDARLETRERQARSVEAMVMTIPYVNKIKLLTSVSPPLPAPGPTSPGQEIRGAIIAVEGSDKSLLAEVGAFINEYLSSKDFSCAIKTWGTSALPPAADTEMTDVRGDSSTVSIPSDIEEKDPFIEFLSIISGWHQKSLEMTTYITTAPTSAAPPPTEEGASSLKPKVLPIALVPNGFSLTTSDTFALRIPINDSYAPVDHWQWMATLWRGIVGADLTIYVSSVGKEEMSKLPGVEIKADCATIVVRILEGGKMDEKTARRLGFEVVEFVRNVENGFGRT